MVMTATAGSAYSRSASAPLRASARLVAAGVGSLQSHRDLRDLRRQRVGYNPDHTARLVTEVGGTWTRYPAGDHTR
jgi:hypothetical protein